MTDKQIEEALKVCEGRTPGEWRSGRATPSFSRFMWDAVFPPRPYHDPIAYYNYGPEDAAYVATTTHPVTGYEATLRELQEARRLLAVMKCWEGCRCLECRDVDAFLSGEGGKHAGSGSQ